jgi:phospholipid N-methyltransferase
LFNEYYSADRHGYLRYDNDRLADYVVGLCLKNIYEEKLPSAAIELGAGMGRFSGPLVRRFSRITLVEPCPSFAELLEERFTSCGNVTISRSSAGEFLRQLPKDRPFTIFVFHLLHHLSEEQRKEIYEFVATTDSVLIVCEPNPFNPLIMLQILLSRDMAWREEREYLRLTPSRYHLEMADTGLEPHGIRSILPVPPALSDLILRKGMEGAIKQLERLLRRLPFAGSYLTFTSGHQDVFRS